MHDCIKNLIYIEDLIKSKVNHDKLPKIIAVSKTFPIENIFPLIKKFLYSDHEIFLRELISNAVDSTSKLKVLSTAGVVKGDLGETSLSIIEWLTYPRSLRV